MPDEKQSLPGPDFAAGIPTSEIVEGETLLGHVGDQPVIVTRSDGCIFAVGATCPHQGAPLAEGLVVDGQIRCPWHHAAFDLATGEPARPPALGGIPSWNVEEDGDRVVVSRQNPGRRACPIRPASSGPRSVVVVGGGAAGAAAVNTLRLEGYTGRITLVSAESTPPVDRPALSKEYLAGHMDEVDVPLRPDNWYAGLDVQLITGREAKRLDTANKRVLLDDGSELPYGAVLLCTGASPRRLQLGDDAPVHYLRTLADSRAIIRGAESARTAVVIGASFIGLEVAASLRLRGLDVTVVAPELAPLDRILGRQLGQMVQYLHVARGVKFRLGRLAQRATDKGVTLDDRRLVPADLIVAGAGVSPNQDIALQAGLHVDNGIVVNEYLETSAPGVFAAGDVARWPDPRSRRPVRVEHWGRRAASGAACSAQHARGTPGHGARAVLLECALRHGRVVRRACRTPHQDRRRW